MNSHGTNTPEDFSYFGQILVAEFNQRRLKNHYFSLRAFARYLGTPVATLKYIIDGKRLPSQETFDHIALRLNWTRIQTTEVDRKLRYLRQMKRAKSPQLLNETKSI